MIVLPKRPTHYELKNLIVQILFDFWIYQSFGGKALSYLIIGTYLALGVHPMAGHFIAEHYMFVKGVDTFSYYGVLNLFTFNVGYHNEHHDFPFIPSTSLPMLRKIAPEFYEEIPQLQSWCRVLWEYVTDPASGPYNRVRRSFDDKGKVVKSKTTPEYTEEDARRGHNAGKPAACDPNENVKYSSNVLVQRFLHIN